MSEPLSSWERPSFSRGGGDASLFYVAYGNIELNQPLNYAAYRSAGVPAGVEVWSYDKEKQSEGFGRFLEGYVWEQLLISDAPLAHRVKGSTGCVVVRGFVADPPTLDYFRDTIGLLTYLVDRGAVAVYDPYLLKWWDATSWRREVFEPAKPLPRKHTVILDSEDEMLAGTTWLHTRGMCKFGRPDISVHRVAPVYREATIDLIDRFVELQAFGGIVPEGQEIGMNSLPEGGVVRHGGSLDDPDFNNFHFEIVWPSDSSISNEGLA